MTLPFYKYQGAGNDFICCDDRAGDLRSRMDRATVARLCDRHFGIGADGLMLLRSTDGPLDFEMVYFNADGRQSTLCGNGGRCIARFAARLGIGKGKQYHFRAIDGNHHAELLDDHVALSMHDVETVTAQGTDLIVDTGSPHYLQFHDTLAAVDVVTQGRAIRYREPFLADGINVNFVAPDGDGLSLVTYERGVEDETLACGTGVTAAVIGHLHRTAVPDGPFEVAVRAKGGNLSVRGKREGDAYRGLWLIGPAEEVFSGHIHL